MQLKAVSLDCGLEPGLGGRGARGRAISVHEPAVYLEEDKGGMLVIAGEDAGNGPGVILLPGRVSFRRGALSCSPDEMFEAREDRVVIGGGRIVIDLSQAVRRNPALNLPAGGTPGRLANCIRALERAARSRNITGGFGPLFAGRGRICGAGAARAGFRRRPGGALFDRVGVIYRALIEGSRKGVERAALSVIGMGEGLTPSCDDMLAGMAGFFICADAFPVQRARARAALFGIKDAATRGGMRTTPVSRHFLAEAVRGRFMEGSKAMLEAIFSGDDKTVALKAQRVLEYGATSGADFIFGVLLGYAAIAGEQGRMRA